MGIRRRVASLSRTAFFVCAVVAHTSSSWAQNSERLTHSEVPERPMRFWLGILDGYGTLDARQLHTDAYLGTYTAGAYGLYAGYGGFVTPHVQLGGEVAFLGHFSLHRIKAGAWSAFYEPDDFHFMMLTPLCARLTGYLEERGGAFISLTARGGIGMDYLDFDGTLAGAYSAELGYAFLGFVRGGRLSVAAGFQAAQRNLFQASTSEASMTAKYGFLTVRTEL